MSTNEEKSKKKFDCFISYYSGTGFTLANHLKKNIKDFNYTAFLDKEDIDNRIKEETSEWRAEIDRAIENSENFVLIMTWGFKDRPEIKREYKKALATGINVFLFKKADLDNQDLIMEIDNQKFDFSERHYTAFTDECDLLAKVGRTLSGILKPQIHSAFRHEAENLITNEGLEFKHTDTPLIEVVIGATTDRKEWLPSTTQNKYLLSCFPYCSEVEARRNFFECKRNENAFYTVTTQGIFHLILKLAQDDMIYLDDIFRCIARAVLFSLRIMKFHNVKSKQSMIILLRNMGGRKVAFSDLNKWHWQYSFTQSAPQIEFNFDFSPQDEYAEIGKLLLRIYKEICNEAGCLDIRDEIVERRVRDVIWHMSDLYTEYNCNEYTLPRLAFASFSFRQDV